MDNTFTLPDGTVLHTTHSTEQCGGQHCVVHNPLHTHMDSWPLIWREDRGIFERLCPEHNVGHPDPSQFDYWQATGQNWQRVHGCCGCCYIP